MGWKFFSFFLYGTVLPGLIKEAEEDPQRAAVHLGFCLLRLYTFAELGELDRHG